MIEAQLLPLLYGDPPNRYSAWYPDEDMQKALKELPELAVTFPMNMQYSEALQRIVRLLLRPLDLTQSGQVEKFVQGFLQSGSLRRTHQTPPAGVPSDTNWLQLGDMEEHASWLENERQLLDLLGDDLSRQHLVMEGTAFAAGNSDDLTKAVLAKQGDFVAVIDQEGRFKRLLDRGALVVRIAAQ